MRLPQLLVDYARPLFAAYLTHWLAACPRLLPPAFPQLLSRQRLPRDYELHLRRAQGGSAGAAPEGDDYYITHKDLRIGARETAVVGSDRAAGGPPHAPWRRCA